MRLDKYVMNALQISKSDAKRIIKQKQIYINDNIVTNCDFSVSDEIIRYGQKELIYKENIYLIMNKPKGYVCAKSDNVNPTVMDLITDYDVRKLNIVGRLDKDTTGLLIITTDGKMVHHLTSPKHIKEKEYYVLCDNPFNENDVLRAKEGVEIKDEDGSNYVCKSSIIKINRKNNYGAYITITEGKFHQIKKMCKALNKEVLELSRIRISELVLEDNLQLGCYRELTNDEINSLLK